MGYCQDNNAHLAEIADEETQLALTALMDSLTGGDCHERTGDGFAWIGGHDITNEGHWRWIYSGKEVDNYYWNDGQPNGGTTQNVLMFNCNGWFDGTITTEYSV